ncbi:MAG TPA: prephenate dehydratase [Verrucomicrobiales bacterium]|nr:prephenate dehydratase [Verrucomicrobiales bacterium]
MPLEDLRKKIDALDAELLRLLNDRADLVHEIGVIKKAQGLQIYAPEREEAVFQGLVRKNAEANGRLPEKSIRAIYREIMSAALALEDDLRIAFLGPAGTWTHQAAINKFGASVDYAPVESLEEVFDAVARRQAHYGVVPIENTSEGAAIHTLDLFADSPLHICAQILLRIENCLMAAGPREEIRTLYSHAAIFAQCRLWLQKHFPKADLIEVPSTTRAAEIASRTPNAGALGGALAAQLHGLNVLDSSIQDHATNTTRFLVIGERTCPPTGRDRTSIMFSVRNEPGSLFHALAPFNELHINMSRIESRPSRRRDWEYFLFVDVLGHEQDQKVATALNGLAQHCSFVKILGSYPNFEG